MTRCSPRGRADKRTVLWRQMLTRPSGPGQATRTILRPEAWWAWAAHASAPSSSGTPIDPDRDRPGGRGHAQARVVARDVLGRLTKQRETADVDALAAQRPAGEARVRSRSTPDVHDAGAGSQRIQAGLQGLPPQCVDDQVEALPRRVGQLQREIGIGQTHGKIGARLSARRQPSSLRAAATIQPAPAARAVCTATWPTIPEAPNTRTRSPGTSAPRFITGIHPARPATPMAAAIGAGTSSGTATR